MTARNLNTFEGIAPKTESRKLNQPTQTHTFNEHTVYVCTAKMFIYIIQMECVSYVSFEKFEENYGSISISSVLQLINLLVLSPIGSTLDVPFLVEVILFPHLAIDRMKAANNSNPLNPVNGKANTI